MTTEVDKAVSPAPAPAPIPPVPFSEALALWARIGLVSFGGPAGQIALMQRLLVDEKGWLSERRFLHALSFCMLLPGPEAMQLATYAGWLLHGVRGGLVAGLLFVLPGAVVVTGLAMIYVAFGHLPLVTAGFIGIKAAVLAIVLHALLRMAGRALTSATAKLLALGGFAALFLFALPFPVVITAAAVVGFLLLGAVKADPADDDILVEKPTSLAGTLSTLAVWLIVWWLPLGGLAWTLGADHLLAQAGLFFSKLAVVTFGGAYAVLAYMSQQAVDNLGWLNTAQMIDGLGLAETTPGPLILVTLFVAFMAGYQALGGGLGLALAAVLVALWATFAPCFLWIFAGAPYVERLRAQKRLTGALSGISAAVVGVIGNLAVWFALQVLFGELGTFALGPLSLPLPRLASLDVVAVIIAAVSVYLMQRRGWGALPLVVTAAGLGVAAGLVPAT